jgi:hypothetical protein
VTEQFRDLAEEKIVEPQDVRQFYETFTGMVFRPITIVRSDVTVFSISAAGAVAVSPDGVLAAANYFIYPNMIVWWDSAAAPPAGWSICDGAGGTPDLRDRFIVGAGSTYARGATGGAASHTHSHLHTGPSHNHDINHTHSIDIDHNHAAVTSGVDSLNQVIADTGFGTDVALHDHTHEVNLPNHVESKTSGSASTGNSGSGGTGNTSTDATAANTGLPPYYSLFVIRRMT